MSSAWRRAVPTFAVWVIALASVLQWRRSEIFTGSVDPTVIAKAVVAVIGVAAAVLLRRTAPSRRQLSVFPTLIVLTVTGIALIGAQSAGTLEPNLVLTVRILLLVVTILTVLSVTSPAWTIVTLLAAMSAIGVVAAATGAYEMYLTPGVSDRLGGGIPPLQPNGLAALVLPGAIGLVYLLVAKGIRLLPGIALVVLTGIIYETGSRTALAMLAVGAVVVLLCARRVPRAVTVIGLVGVVLAYAAIFFTGAFQALLLRGQDAADLGTLNSRTIAWNVVLSTPHDTWAWWIGNGLSVKTVAVLGQYWTTQVFDSSWISSLAQDGVIGTALLAIYVAGTLIAATVNRSIRPFVLPQVITTVIISFVENGLIESSFTFVLFFTLALVSWPGRTVGTAEPIRSEEHSAHDPQPGPRVLAYPAHLLERTAAGAGADASEPMLSVLTSSGLATTQGRAT